jgi:hypothetical protein
MPFQSGDFWDQPSSFRLLEGLISTANNFAKISAPFAYLDMDLKTKNLNVFYNCLQENVNSFLESPINSDMFEMRGAQ